MDPAPNYLDGDDKIYMKGDQRLGIDTSHTEEKLLISFGYSAASSEKFYKRGAMIFYCDFLSVDFFMTSYHKD